MPSFPLNITMECPRVSRGHALWTAVNCRPGTYAGLATSRPSPLARPRVARPRTSESTQPAQRHWHWRQPLPARARAHAPGEETAVSRVYAGAPALRGRRFENGTQILQGVPVQGGGVQAVVRRAGPPPSCMTAAAPLGDVRSLPFLSDITRECPRDGPHLLLILQGNAHIPF